VRACVRVCVHGVRACVRACVRDEVVAEGHWSQQQAWRCLLNVRQQSRSWCGRSIQRVPAPYAQRQPIPLFIHSFIRTPPTLALDAEQGGGTTIGWGCTT